jgi:hypothetical protein
LLVNRANDEGNMRLVTIVFERIPMVWLLLGLLFIAAGLYLGFEYKLTFVYLIIGAFCSLYGLLLFIFLRIERPKRSSGSTVSPQFISSSDTASMPALRSANEARTMSQAKRS